MTDEAHPRHQLDPVIHQPVRFSIMATLARADEAEFGLVRDIVQITDSALSKQISTLEAAGLVQTRKGYVGKYPRTWLRLSSAGRTSFESHIAALRDIAEGTTRT